MIILYYILLYYIFVLYCIILYYIIYNIIYCIYIIYYSYILYILHTYILYIYIYILIMSSQIQIFVASQNRNTRSAKFAWFPGGRLSWCLATDRGQREGAEFQAALVEFCWWTKSQIVQFSAIYSYYLWPLNSYRYL